MSALLDKRLSALIPFIDVDLLELARGDIFKISNRLMDMKEKCDLKREPFLEQLSAIDLEHYREMKQNTNKDFADYFTFFD
ncbi:hypothetical protein Ciccas_000621 [Cichlidogyrus casuarinus]|uniref:Uncharacterized protein n=1 Tax=Cichlidogyrus casuarinus TaxID=1844966 RepID=A0ABD2QMC8_9PLAT